jgi:hypothetical protein
LRPQAAPGDWCDSLFLCPLAIKAYVAFVENACQENKSLRVCGTETGGRERRTDRLLASDNRLFAAEERG